MSRMVLAVPSVGGGGLDAARSGHFGRCDSFTLVELVDDDVASVSVLVNPPHAEGGCLRPVGMLASAGVTAIVVAGMGARPFAGFRQAGIDVYFENETSRVGDVVNLVLLGLVGPMDDDAICGGNH